METRVVLGGTLNPHKGVNLPGAQLDVPGLTAKDIQDLQFGLQLGVDAVAISFVRQAQDIELVRQTLTQAAPNQRLPLIIAKLERPEALDNLEAIIDAVDGVMVARGDLGVEMPPESVPIAQKRIIELANQKARLVITATQMLESMIHNPRPTRAEASDVANAIFDGSDAVMLSAETAAGLYPGPGGHDDGRHRRASRRAQRRMGTLERAARAGQPRRRHLLPDPGSLPAGPRPQRDRPGSLHRERAGRPVCSPRSDQRRRSWLARRTWIPTSA